MAYTEAQIAEIKGGLAEVVQGFQNLGISCIREGLSVNNNGVEEYMLRGAGRRLRVLSQSIQNIFRLFPLDAKNRLQSDVLFDVQINLHAYLMNVYGVFDNFAWAFVHRHGLIEEVGGKNRVGLFQKATQALLPAPLKAHLEKDSVQGWFSSYLKEYRDALAHRIPAYIPPYLLTEAEAARFNELDVEMKSAIMALNLERLKQLEAEQNDLGVPCFTFLHSFSEEQPPRPIYLHPQLISDGRGVLEIGALFIRHWGLRR